MKALTSIYNIDYQPILHHHTPPPFGHLLYLRGGVFIRFRIFTHPPLCVKDTVFALSYNHVEHRSNSFTFGNAHASMALLSLNHSFASVLDDDALVVAAHGLSHEVVTLAALEPRCVKVDKTGDGGFLEGGAHGHGSRRHLEGVSAILTRSELQ